MGNLKKQTILMVNYKTLQKIFSHKNNIDYSKLGLRLHQNIALNKLMFGKYKIINRPFALHADNNTYDSRRSIVVDYVVEDIIIKNKQIGRTDRTIVGKIDLIAEFLKWLDKEKLDFLFNINLAQNVFHLFSSYLRLRIRDGSYAQQTASQLQRTALQMLQAIHRDKKNKIASGIKMIRRGTAKSTEKSSDDDRVYQFNFYSKLFNEISDFLLQEQKYPHQLKLHNKDVWIVPQNPIFLAGHGKYHINVFNHNKGKTRSVKELFNDFKYANINSASCQKRDFIRRLKKANTDMNATERLRLASVALKAYYMTFLAVTGMNDSTAATLPWKDHYLIEKEQHKFRNIKYRAHGKTVEFELEQKFVKSFHKFIKLRKYLLIDKHFPHLFFLGYGEKANLSSIQEKGNFAKSINTYMIKKIDPLLPLINSKEMRVNKTHIVLERHGLIAASLSAQSSITTITKHYTGESADSSSEQMTKVFDHLNKNLICTDEDSVNISVGQCRNLDNPKSEITLRGVATDCKQAEGCLFCDKYACHADDIDIRKLYSLQFIIEETRMIANNEAHFLSVYKQVLDRIQEILSEIEKIGNEMKCLVKKIYHDVFENENLDSYWNHKLKTLIQMGVLK